MMLNHLRRLPNPISRYLIFFSFLLLLLSLSGVVSCSPTTLSLSPPSSSSPKFNSSPPLPSPRQKSFHLFPIFLHRSPSNSPRSLPPFPPIRTISTQTTSELGFPSSFSRFSPRRSFPGIWWSGLVDEVRFGCGWECDGLGFVGWCFIAGLFVFLARCSTRSSYWRRRVRWARFGSRRTWRGSSGRTRSRIRISASP